MFQFSNHDGDLRHSVRPGPLHQGFKDLSVSEPSAQPSPPPALKATQFSGHIVETNVAYDCADKVTKLENVPVMLR